MVGNKEYLKNVQFKGSPLEKIKKMDEYVPIYLNLLPYQFKCNQSSQESPNENLDPVNAYENWCAILGHVFLVKQRGNLMGSNTTFLELISQKSKA